MRRIDSGARRPITSCKNADGSLYVAPVWPGPSVFPDFTRSRDPRLVGRAVQGLHRRRRRRLLERHERAGGVRDADQDDAARQPSTASTATISRRATRPMPRSTTSTAWRIRARTFDGLLKLRPDVRPFVMTRASLCRRAALCGHLDRRQQLDLGSSASCRCSRSSISACRASPTAAADVGGFAGGPSPDLLTRWYRDRRVHADLPQPFGDTTRRAPSRGSTAPSISRSAAASSRSAIG